ncbi:hypothetical protein G5C33_16510 [Sphingosinithalassobacter tenebrarum]|uniref:DUF3052 domain-containing protein n=2 Tax=Stakelama tenebrarum TaxID=2711215 RepID=A0A6G6Y8P6_9SPHN|nr:hypothetical protein G5C33_16510 [Sphingosinithalassobacter tenebrarum]
MTTAGVNMPLASKLGLTRGMRSWFCHMPDHVRDAIAPEDMGVEEQSSPSDGMQAAILFVTERAQLERKLHALRPLLQPKGFIWAVWPRRGDIGTDITEDAVRGAALPMGLIDGNLIDIDDNWSGLKLLVRHAES